MHILAYMDYGRKSTATHNACARKQHLINITVASKKHQFQSFHGFESERYIRLKEVVKIKYICNALYQYISEYLSTRKVLFEAFTIKEADVLHTHSRGEKWCNTNFFVSGCVA